jgi:succinyl-diaminopimelate desuccinylase
VSVDPIHLTQSLVRCRSVTPEEGGALVLLDEVLSEAGFACTRADRGGVANLFARFGPRGHPRTLGFNGHTDVVPPGDSAAWSADPFSGALIDGHVFGRGSVDMKSGVAAFVAAADRLGARGPGGRRIDPDDHRRRGRQGGGWHPRPARLDGRQTARP